MNIGPTIKQARLAVGMTQEQAAYEADWARPVWADLERDRGSPTVATLARVGGALGLELHITFRRPRRKR